MCADKPGWRHARSLQARSSEMAWRSMRRASKRSRKSFIIASAFHALTGRNGPASDKAPSVTRRCPCGCHCIKSPDVAMETTMPGRVPDPISLRMYSPSASAQHWASSSSSSRRFLKIPRSSRGMVKAAAGGRVGPRGARAGRAALGREQQGAGSPRVPVRHPRPPRRGARGVAHARRARGRALRPPCAAALVHAGLAEVARCGF
jgi:hypothetical protein